MIRKNFLPLSKPHVNENEIQEVEKILRTGWWTTGPKVFEFERQLSAYLTDKDTLYTAALNSCTSAIFLALKAMNIDCGDEVIVPTWTFAATAHIVEWLGAKPILCDIEGDSLSIDYKKAEELITSKTKAIIPVHIAGYPYDINRIEAMANQYKLIVIEDAAHAIGSKYKGVKIGNYADITCFSFYATKNLAMGEGGAAVSKNFELIEKIKKLSYFGINKNSYINNSTNKPWAYDIEEIGYKCNLDSMHATLGLVQLKKLDIMNGRRREIAKIYKQNIDPVISFTKDSEEHFHIYHLFPILLPEDIDRDEFINQLNQRNVGSSVHFIPLHKHSYFKKRFPSDQFPEANRLFERILSIPMFPSMTNEDVDYVIESINYVLRKMYGRL